MANGTRSLTERLGSGAADSIATALGDIDSALTLVGLIQSDNPRTADYRLTGALESLHEARRYLTGLRDGTHA